MVRRTRLHAETSRQIYTQLKNGDDEGSEYGTSLRSVGLYSLLVTLKQVIGSRKGLARNWFFADSPYACFAMFASLSWALIQGRAKLMELS